jgi:GINS complex subunit 2
MEAIGTELRPEEKDFLAENQIISIIPNFQEDKLNLICGDFGPFRPNKPIDVFWSRILGMMRSRFPSGWQCT